MPKNIVDKVFEPFFTTKGVGKGSGLGLSMVYGFIKQSKGHIKIYSEPGRGTTIKIYLPRTAEAEEPMRPATEEPAPLGTENILLVEDDPAVRASVLWQLRNLGYTVTEATNGEEALALMAAGGFDAIVSDMVMPGRQSGLMVLEEAARRWPKVGTILMSGYTENCDDPGRAAARSCASADQAVHQARAGTRPAPGDRDLEPRPTPPQANASDNAQASARELRARRTSP